MSSDSDTVQTTQQSTPYLPQMDHLTGAFGEAARLYNRGTQFPDAYQQLANRYSPNPMRDSRRAVLEDQSYYNTQNLYDIARGQKDYQLSPDLQRFASGEMLSPDSNPWLKGMYDDAAEAVRGQINSQFGTGRAYGSGANQEVLGKNLSTLANSMYGGAYQQGVQQMLSANMLGDQLLAQNLPRQMQAIQQMQGMTQGMDNDLYKLGAIQQGQIDAPWLNLQRYMGVVNPGINFGSTQTQQTPYFQNQVGQGLGLLGGGLSLANMAFGQNGLFPGALQSGWNSLGNMFGGGGYDPFSFSLPAGIDNFSAGGFGGYL